MFGVCHDMNDRGVAKMMAMTVVVVVVATMVTIMKMVMVDSLLKVQFSNEESHNKENEVVKEKVVEEREGIGSTSANLEKVVEK